MAFCERLSEQLAVVATIDPVSQGATAITSDAFSMALHRRALFILQTGLGAATTGMAVAIQENTFAGFTGTTGTLTIIAATAAAVILDDSQYLFEVSAEAMAAGFTHLRAVVTPVGAANLISMVVLADVERYHPATDTPDLASVVSIQAHL